MPMRIGLTEAIRLVMQCSSASGLAKVPSGLGRGQSCHHDL